ncbi:MAG: hypothetical protein JO142_17920 [Burkholderiales bacterium]|nr:hypothetical protein [Burkholderiales bacterium]
MRLIVRRLLSCLALYMALLGASWADTVPLHACGADPAWPPSAFARAGRDGVSGIAVDVLKAAFQGTHYSVDVHLVPLARCMAEVRLGQRYQIAIGAIGADTHYHGLLLTSGYLALTPAYYFLRRDFPHGIQLREPSDLRLLKLCGLAGYSYAPFTLKPNEIDAGSADIDSVLAKLRLNRCDLFPEYLEVHAGYAQQLVRPHGWSELSGGLVPKLAKTNARYLVSRNREDADDIAQLIDAKLAVMQRSGTLRTMQRAYLK